MFMELNLLMILYNNINSGRLESMNKKTVWIVGGGGGNDYSETNLVSE